MQQTKQAKKPANTDELIEKLSWEYKEQHIAILEDIFIPNPTDKYFNELLESPNVKNCPCNSRTTVRNAIKDLESSGFLTEDTSGNTLVKPDKNREILALKLIERWKKRDNHKSVRLNCDKRFNHLIPYYLRSHGKSTVAEVKRFLFDRTGINVHHQTLASIMVKMAERGTIKCDPISNNIHQVKKGLKKRRRRIRRFFI